LFLAFWFLFLCPFAPGRSTPGTPRPALCGPVSRLQPGRRDPIHPPALAPAPSRHFQYRDGGGGLKVTITATSSSGVTGQYHPPPAAQIRIPNLAKPEPNKGKSKRGISGIHGKTLLPPLLSAYFAYSAVTNCITSLTCSSNLSFGFGMKPSRGLDAFAPPIYEPICLINTHGRSLWKALFSPYDALQDVQYEAHCLLA
jgi:hypothetical protein